MSSLLQSLVAEFTLGELADRSGQSVEGIVTWAMTESSRPRKPRAKKPERTRVRAAKPARAPKQKSRKPPPRKLRVVEDDAPRDLDRSVLRLIQEHPEGVSRPDLEARLKLSESEEKQLRSVLARLLKSEAIEMVGTRRWAQYRPIEATAAE